MVQLCEQHAEDGAVAADECARCGSPLCAQCMEEGCCGSIPALSLELDGEEEEEPLPNDTVSICGCGYPLVPYLDKDGIRTGVKHRTSKEDFHHMDYFAGMRVEMPDGPP